MYIISQKKINIQVLIENYYSLCYIFSVSFGRDNPNGGAPVSTGTSSGYRLQMERPSPDWAKNLTANKNVSYNYALAA